jgi:hypothetical protein
MRAASDRTWRLLLIAFAMSSAPPCLAAQPSSECEAATATAARAQGVPPAVLYAILRTESGRGPQSAPWPWAVNVEGTGHWPATRAEAVDLVERARAQGVTSVDIGCFQINLRWHGDAFTSVDAMFDPDANAAYAAAFLARLARETGSWRTAAGAYHSRTPERAEAYRTRLEAVHARLAGAAPAPDHAPRPQNIGLPAMARPLIDLGAAVRPLIGGTP